MKKLVFSILLTICSSFLQAASLPAPEQSGIKHIVVVMMENRSFDHLLGWLPGAEGRQAGLSYTNTNGVAFSTYPLAPDFQGCGHPDPDHSYTGGRIEFNNGACDGWLRAGQNDIFSIGYYQQTNLSFLGPAATNWTVCDNYFAPILSSTFPNRIYMHAAQTDRTNNSLAISSLPTIWDRLGESNRTGRYYFSDIPLLALWGVKYVPIMRFTSSFYDDAASGNLPDVACVEPRFVGASQGISEDYHPVSDVRAAEHFLSKIYNAVVSGPAWSNTVLIITFDEWGGFFEHVPPPAGPVPDADRAAGDASGQRGFRVPTLVISPWSPRGVVDHQIFDHTSILKMIEWRFGLEPLSIRDQTAHNLVEVLNFGTTNTNAPVIIAPEVISFPCALRQPQLSLTGTNLTLNWTADAKLQASTNLTGPWTDVTNAVNGFTMTRTEPVQFFRVINDFDELYSLVRSLGIPLP